MLVACWSAKGGSGTTVVSAALALVLSRSSPPGALLVDLAGDAPAALGLLEPTGPGLAAWLEAGPDVPVGALTRLEVDAGPTLRLLALGPAGTTLPSEPGRADDLAAAFVADPRPVVVDCGTVWSGGGQRILAAPLAMIAGATLSLLVLRPCYLALRRAVAAPVRPSGVVLLTEPGRALGRADVEDVLGVPVRAEVAVDPAVARAVDSGLLLGRVPRQLERALRVAA